MLARLVGEGLEVALEGEARGCFKQSNKLLEVVSRPGDQQWAERCWNTSVGFQSVCR